MHSEKEGLKSISSTAFSNVDYVDPDMSGLNLKRQHLIFKAVNIFKSFVGASILTLPFYNMLVSSQGRPIYWYYVLLNNWSIYLLFNILNY